MTAYMALSLFMILVGLGTNVTFLTMQIHSLRRSEALAIRALMNIAGSLCVVAGIGLLSFYVQRGV